MQQQQQQVDPQLVAQQHALQQEALLAKQAQELRDAQHQDWLAAQRQATCQAARAAEATAAEEARELQVAQQQALQAQQQAFLHAAEVVRVEEAAAAEVARAQQLQHDAAKLAQSKEAPCASTGPSSARFIPVRKETTYHHHKGIPAFGRKKDAPAKVVNVPNVDEMNLQPPQSWVMPPQQTAMGSASEESSSKVPCTPATADTDVPMPRMIARGTRVAAVTTLLPPEVEEHRRCSFKKATVVESATKKREQDLLLLRRDTRAEMLHRKRHDD